VVDGPPVPEQKTARPQGEEIRVSYFSQSKGDNKTPKPAAPEARLDATPAPKSAEIVSTLGQGMLITGNIVCAGSVQIFGRVIGDIHASQLVICEGAKVEGKIIAPETVIRGTFNGTINSNSVKLQATAVVDGEIYNKSLTIEQNAQFEGVARRLDTPVAAPSSAQVKGEDNAPALAPQAAPAGDVVI
jgi:cytoskeletal protein CcmA (bactofilin family)